MHSTHLRGKHVHGVLLGTAVGEALGYPRKGLDRRQALRLYGPPPLRYQFMPGRGVYGENTRLMLLNAQALLNSRNDVGNLRAAFRRRLGWYCLSFPPGLATPTLQSGWQSWLPSNRRATGVESDGNQAAARAVFTGPVMHGAGHRIPKWIDDSTKITHLHPDVLEGCRVLGMLALYACENADDWSAMDALAYVLQYSQQAEFLDKLQNLQKSLTERRSAISVARQFGWHSGIKPKIVPTTVMSVYCHLRHPKNFTRAVRAAVTLGGDSATMGAVVGGLTGAHLGNSEIPEKLVQQLGGRPHNADWIESLAARFSHWPHGADDLYMAPAQKSYPLFQLLRNLSLYPAAAYHRGRHLFAR